MAIRVYEDERFAFDRGDDNFGDLIEGGVAEPLAVVRLKPSLPTLECR